MPSTLIQVLAVPLNSRTWDPAHSACLEGGFNEIRSTTKACHRRPEKNMYNKETVQVSASARESQRQSTLLAREEAKPCKTWSTLHCRHVDC